MTPTPEALRKLVAEATDMRRRLKASVGYPPGVQLRRNEDAANLLGRLANALEPLLDASERVGASVPAGWRLVPVEPTHEMVFAGSEALGEWRKTLTRDEVMARSYQAHDRKFVASATPNEKMKIRYAAMLAAAPRLPEPPDE